MKKIYIPTVAECITLIDDTRYSFILALQWAQVILMLELSLKPKERLIALLKYSRPVGTDKRKRAFVVARKITVSFA